MRTNHCQVLIKNRFAYKNLKYQNVPDKTSPCFRVVYPVTKRNVVGEQGLNGETLINVTS